MWCDDWPPRVSMLYCVCLCDIRVTLASHIYIYTKSGVNSLSQQHQIHSTAFVSWLCCRVCLWVSLLAVNCRASTLSPGVRNLLLLAKFCLSALFKFSGQGWARPSSTSLPILLQLWPARVPSSPLDSATELWQMAAFLICLSAPYLELLKSSCRR